MSGKFISSGEVERQRLDWGELAWFSTPSATGARNLVVVEVILSPGNGHNFHKHPRQEEVLYVLGGGIEQWVGPERRLLGPGDTAFIPADSVHASFNIGSINAKLIAILGPCIGPHGYELVDVSNEPPWNRLRT